MEETQNKPFTPQEFTRLATNFYNSLNLTVDYNRIVMDSQLCNYIATHKEDTKKKYKVALLSVCLNPEYWEYAKQMLDGAIQFFLPGHDVDVFLWSDMPKADDEEGFKKAEEKLVILNQQLMANQTGSITSEQVSIALANAKGTIERAREGAKKAYESTIFPVESVEWPMPTLMRYHLYLQQEEKLKEYDFIFHCDVDMLFVNVVGDEILGEGLTATQHPMYALSKEMWPPYEPNKESSAYIKRPGRLINDDGKPRFIPLYFAGGFQGGKTKKWIEAMKEMRKMIDADLARGYMAIWNDESIWNKYLADNLNDKDVILTPSYIYQI